MIQAHHDHCDHETLTRDEEELVHTWESSCVRCSIQRKYNPALMDCPIVNCNDLSVIDSAIWIINTTCVAAEHGSGEDDDDHDHRRRRRKLSGDDDHDDHHHDEHGECCENQHQKGAFRQLVAYHDLCDHDVLPPFVEVGIHDYEEACEAQFCNAVSSTYDGTTCPSPPSPPGPPPAASMETSTVIVIIAICAVVIVLIFLCVCLMASKEKAGKPIFTSIGGAAKA